VLVLVYLLYCVCIACLDAGMLARSQYSEGPATGHLDTGFSWFHRVYKQMLRWLPRFQVATTCFSCSPPDLNLLVTNFIFCVHAKWPLPPGDIIIIIIIIIINRENSTLANPLNTRISLKYMYFRIQFIMPHKQIAASPWTAWPTKMGSLRCPETSVNNY
jgi:hypothetical protein